MTRPPALASLRRAVLRSAGGCVVAALAGCLSVPVGEAPMCESTLDCDGAHGEVCEQGVCWGNPPPGMFAAVISPPSTRRDAVPRELPPFLLSGDGWMGELSLDSPVLLNGRIVAFCPAPMAGCDAVPLAATVTVSRRSLFNGGPGFKTIVNVAGGVDSFTIPLPPTLLGDAPYIVTIVPDDTRPVGVSSANPSPAEQVPPLRMQLRPAANTTLKSIELGGQGLPVISGNLSNMLGQGLSGYRISALGHWDPSEPVTEVSTVDYTDATGNYALTLSAGLVDTVEIVARPIPDPTSPTPPVIAPTVHLRNIDATQSSQRSAVAPVNLGTGTTMKIAVTGVELNGTISKVRGAVVSVSGVLASTLTSFTISDEQITDDEGEVTLHLLDGAGIAGTYQLSVTPPAGSPHSAVFEQKLTVSPLTTAVKLGARIALRGVIQDIDGRPLTNVAITARPSLRFLWSLDAEPQAFVSAIPAATAVTPETGEFVLWVDAIVDQIWGHYDLMIEPPTTAQAPTYIASDLLIPRSSTLDAFSVGTLVLPDAAYVHGVIRDSAGEAVDGAELKLYRIESQGALCTEVAHAPASCPIPAQLQGRGTADGTGAVRVVLPRTATADN